ncbi:unnamed protein product [Leptidea sinapis]|uniref:HTH CENPB-type domain-containing protein n=1 Tax=Leptidea sinapis TaxID=189913 RepID=A0A5E4QUN0_9NEOP|nr:unnamed protein product [Leptidea sinapis]
MAAPGHRTSLSIKDKLCVLEMIEKGDSRGTIARQYNISLSTVGNIRRNKDRILKYVSQTESGPGERKRIRKGDYPDLEDALYKWFVEQRELNVQLTAKTICESAINIYCQMPNPQIGFNASRGWARNFMRRYDLNTIEEDVEFRLESLYD